MSSLTKGKLMYPLRFEPIEKPYVWGHESWLLSDRSEAMSVVANGSYRGATFRELCDLLKEKLIGRDRFFSSFPLLIKTITSHSPLSLQVHPNEKNGARFQGEAKTESWVMLKKSLVYAGFKEGVLKHHFLDALEQNRVESLIEPLELAEGDSVHVPAGLVHAIGGGSYLLEVQQNSNTTYRLYDWGRVSRKLHLEEGLESIDWDLKREVKISNQENVCSCELLVDSSVFCIERVKVEKEARISVDLSSFQILFCEQGKGCLMSESFERGVMFLIPAALGSLSIQGCSQWIRVRLPSL